MHAVQLVRIAIFLAELTAVLLVNKGAASGGLPPDAPLHGRLAVWSPFEVANDLQQLGLWAVTLCFLTRVNTVERFFYLYAWSASSAVFHLLLFAAGPGFAALSLVPFLQHSVSSGSPPAFIALICGGGGGILAILVWHMYHAVRNERVELVEWLGVVVGVPFFYILYFSLQLAATAHPGSWHLHHCTPLPLEHARRILADLQALALLSPLMSLLLGSRLRIVAGWIGWCLALPCRWNHIVSSTSLAVASAVFVQGIASYGDHDPLVRPPLWS